MLQKLNVRFQLDIVIIFFTVKFINVITQYLSLPFYSEFYSVTI